MLSFAHRFPFRWARYFVVRPIIRRRAMSYADRTLTCRDCGTEFVFTAGEQEFSAQKGFTNEPTRCQSCRQTRKSGGGGGGGYSNRNSYGGRDDSNSSRPREMHTAICASCGKEAQ